MRPLMTFTPSATPIDTATPAHGRDSRTHRRTHRRPLLPTAPLLSPSDTPRRRRPTLTGDQTASPTSRRPPAPSVTAILPRPALMPSATVPPTDGSAVAQCRPVYRRPQTHRRKRKLLHRRNGHKRPRHPNRPHHYHDHAAGRQRDCNVGAAHPPMPSPVPGARQRRWQSRQKWRARRWRLRPVMVATPDDATRPANVYLLRAGGRLVGAGLCRRLCDSGKPAAIRKASC